MGDVRGKSQIERLYEEASEDTAVKGWMADTDRIILAGQAHSHAAVLEGFAQLDKKIDEGFDRVVVAINNGNGNGHRTRRDRAKQVGVQGSYITVVAAVVALATKLLGG